MINDHAKLEYICKEMGMMLDNRKTIKIISKKKKSIIEYILIPKNFIKIIKSINAF